MAKPFDPYDLLPSVPSFELSSADIADGMVLDVAQTSAIFGGPGQDSSPHLAWNGHPAETLSFAVTCFDPDALTVSGFWHWAVYDIPASVNELLAGAGDADGKRLPAGARMLANDAGRRGFLGAAPPPGEAAHRYMFVVHALDTPRLDITTEATPAWLGFRLVAHGLARARLTPVFGMPA
ncbi:YbhB/YbcL family Raf kinase inhibitor-like protein [Streptomyces cynarae]|uniref:YbhB/YbcL family Raf kinase inhibitor-like protein n=1 Tax=Streptomyces cynarae TaxID=2981134 RepID=A0ABY6E3V9_9ACTN|nr:YbhB/YbcL family Raf kinase inhibitor-like protein [Streptomyces cynarae]UXY21355.1 YbhB/YbcL family Raf kinase inhibitor-like protein [Streptomyces cynarae]